MQIRSFETFVCSGTFNLSGVASVLCKSGVWLRSFLQQEDEVEHPISLLSGCTWNAPGTPLPTTPANDDLGIVPGTWGTDALTLQTINQGSNGTETWCYGLFRTSVPKEWVSGETLKLRIKGGMVTAVSDATATVDAEIYKPNSTGGVGSDLCATTATTINSALLSAGEITCDFTITTTGLVAGDIIEVRVGIGIDDTATGTVKGAINHLSLLADIKG